MRAPSGLNVVAKILHCACCNQLAVLTIRTRHNYLHQVYHSRTWDTHFGVSDRCASEIVVVMPDQDGV